ncbi:hypothetical protein QQZ08_001839 [Neonectria magnoliae]|uniref:Uncharacterized protein n=1 Tax=Neonectria magnoliae TaxID=2732573 RepID=A0ABR1IDH2_9HYPO
MLNEIQVLLKWQPKSPDPAKIPVGWLETNLRQLTLDFSSEYCIVRMSNGDDVGVLEGRALRALGPLVLAGDDSPVKYDAFMPAPEWQESIKSMVNQGRKGKLVTVSVSVFGPRYKGEEVARRLGNAKLFLQCPTRWTMQVYENPQCLDLPLSIRQDRGPTFHMSGDHTTDPNEVAQQEDSSDSDSKNDDESSAPDLTRIFGGVNQHEYSGAIEIDPRIITNLHLYIPEERASKSRLIPTKILSTAEDSPGGIIADDMGLGKTLMMMAAILGSANHAQQFLAQTDSESVNDPVQNHHSILNTKATLDVVLSELLLANWTKEIEKHTVPGAIKYYKYHGRERTIDPALFCNYDIILTTYGTIAADFSTQRGTLRKVHWYRTVLDEAHTIRNWSIRQFNAVHDIPARIRWCMTGTPIQNGLKDLGSLVRFLRVPIFEDIATFRRHICVEAESTKTMKHKFPNLRLLLSSICLQRTRDLLQLHSIWHVNRLEFSEQERHKYLTMEAACKQAISMAVNSGKSKASHHNVLEKLLRLREYCNGITNTSPNGVDDLLSIMEQSGELLCAYCTAEISSVDPSLADNLVQLTECGRLICSDICCSLQYSSQIRASEPACPFCSVPHKKDNILGITEDDHTPDGDSYQSFPSKLQYLFKDVKLHLDEEKCIIFSVWKRTLNLVEDLFTANGIQYCRVDGSVSTTMKRKKILLDFQERKDMRVLLITLGTGAVGLNDLSVASRVHLLEPQWNPSVERQAIGRVLRLGQEQEVKIIRYIMRGSIEELVEKRQIQKLRLASGGFNLEQLAKDMKIL